MDPQRTLHDILVGLSDGGDRETIADQLRALADWIERDGVMPNVDHFSSPSNGRFICYPDGGPVDAVKERIKQDLTDRLAGNHVG